MSTYFKSPGAWLGAGLYPDPWRAGFYPDPPRRAGFYPDPWLLAALYPDPPRRSGSYPPVDGAGNYPPVDGAGHYPPVDGAGHYPPVDGAGHYPDPPRGPRTAGVPWLGVDPAWAYASGDEGLRALALRKVRTRIVRPTDPRLPRPSDPGSASAAPAMHALWRWETPWRVKAVAGELMGRFAVRAKGDAASVLRLPSPGARGRADVVVDLRWPDHENFDFDRQIDRVVRAAVEREDRLPEILTQRHDIGAFFDAVSGINRAASPRFSELLLALSEATEYLLMGLKHHAGVHRPAQRSGLVQPVISAPGHGSLPSGHATMAAVNARLLTLMVFRNDESSVVQLDLLARRIAFNRVVAGVHFPMDSAAGYQLGHALVDAFIGLALGVPLGGTASAFLPKAESELGERADSGVARPAVPAVLAGALDADATALRATRVDRARRQAPARASGRKAVSPSAGTLSGAPLLAELFRAAREELSAQLR